MIRQPRRRLRTILLIWFVLFSIVPLAFVTLYSVIKYEKALNNELGLRLDGNSREIALSLGEILIRTENIGVTFSKNVDLRFFLANSNANELLSLGTQQLTTNGFTSANFYNRNGRLISSVFKDEKGNQRQFVPSLTAGGGTFLSNQVLERLKNQTSTETVSHLKRGRVSVLSVFRVVDSSETTTIGFVEIGIDLGINFLRSIKGKLNLELALLRPNRSVVVSTKDSIGKELSRLAKTIPENEIFEVSDDTEQFGFRIFRVPFGQDSVVPMALGISKVDALAVLRNVNTTFFVVVGAVAVLLLLTIVATTNAFIRPIQNLIDGIREMQISEQNIEIPIRSDTEIGILTESFNEMSRSVLRARRELEAKITELELANEELKSAQSKLVHTSKMVSLGQLVAGVAHELNNPIGFIFSNMGHLREYSDELLRLIDIAEKNPSRLKEQIEKSELEYIKSDLPKLIASCEDGARRTKEIVIGLRNFSRLEKAVLSELDIHTAIDNTLNLLSGELKGRIQIHRVFGDIPKISCYATQVNQVLMNLLSNAAQAIKDSGNIWITTSMYRPPQSTKNFVRISIQDSGQGISQENLEKIFDPFFSTKGVGQGTGLGLSISYGIIQSHGGDLFVKSQVGIGSEFTIQIPVKAELTEQKDSH